MAGVNVVASVPTIWLLCVVDVTNMVIIFLYEQHITFQFTFLGYDKFIIVVMLVCYIELIYLFGNF